MSHIIKTPHAAAPVIIPAAALAAPAAPAAPAETAPVVPVTPAAATPDALASALPAPAMQTNPAAQAGNVAKGAATTAAGLGFNATNLTGAGAAGGTQAAGFAGASTTRKSLLGG